LAQENEVCAWFEEIVLRIDPARSPHRWKHRLWRVITSIASLCGAAAHIQYQRVHLVCSARLLTVMSLVPFASARQQLIQLVDNETYHHRKC
jgi:hypothetical protein